MELRRLGTSTLEVPPLALRGNVIGCTIDEARAFDVPDDCTATDGRFIDSAHVDSRWMPGNGRSASEATFGRGTRARGARRRVVVATRIGTEMGSDTKGLSRARTFASVEAFPTRLRTGRTNLFLSLQDDPTAPVEAALETHATLIRRGIAGAIGASNSTAERLQASLDTPTDRGLPVSVSLQPHCKQVACDAFEGPLERPRLNRGRHARAPRPNAWRAPGRSRTARACRPVADPAERADAAPAAQDPGGPRPCFPSSTRSAPQP